MAIQKGSIKDRYQLFQVPRKRMISGGIVFVVLAISFFNFQNLIYFFVILFDALNNDFEPYALTDHNKVYYHFALSIISVQFAFSIVYRYWFEKPRKLWQRRVYKIRGFMTLQRSFHWFFISWFLKLGFVLTLMVMLIKAADFYPDYVYLIWLFAVAFFGQIWMSVRPMFKKSFFGFLLTAILFSGSVFLVSLTDMTNPEKIQTKLLGKNLMYQNDIHLPESGILYHSKYVEYMISDILIPNTDNDSIYFEGRKIQPEDIVREVFRSREDVSVMEEPLLRYAFHIDKNVKMEKVFNIKKTLIEIDVEMIRFMFRTPENNDPFYFKPDEGLSFSIWSNIETDWIADPSKIVTVEILNRDTLLFEGDTLNHQEFRERVKDHFRSDETKSFLILMRPDTSFETYFKTLESTYKVVLDLRDELTLKSYGTNYNSLSRENKKAIIEKHRWHIIERLKE